MNDEQDWAQRLRVDQQTSRRQAKNPLTLQKSVVREALTHGKADLRRACATKNMADVERLLTALIRLRAEITAITIREYKDQHGTLPDAITKKETKRYATDCMRLVATVRRLTKNS